MSIATWLLFGRRRRLAPGGALTTRRRRLSSTTVELAARRDEALEVVLLWDPAAADHVWVDVLNRGSGEGFLIQADPKRALDAFYNPFAYALPAVA